MASSRSTKAELLEEINQLGIKIEELEGNDTGSGSDLESIREKLLWDHKLNQILLDSLPCVALLLRPDTREIVASNEAGRKAGAVPGKHCYDTWGQQETPCPWCLAPDVWSDGIAQHLVVDSLEIIWDAHWYPISEDLYLHYAFDITEQQQAEQTLRRSGEQYRNLFETMQHGVVYQDSTGSIISANPAAEVILGLSLDQMQGRTSVDSRWKSIHEDGSDFPGNTHPSMVALSTGKPVRDVLMGVFHPEKEENRWILINAVPQFKEGEDKPYQVFTTFNDITELHHIQKALVESEAKFRTLFTEMLSGFALHEIIVDEKGNPTDYRFLEVNPAFETLTGLKARDIIGRTVKEVLPEIEDYWIQNYGRVALTGEPITFEGLSAELGKYYNAHAFCPRAGYFAVIFVDTTARNMMEEALISSEGKYRELIEKAGIAIMIYQSEDEITFFNDKFADLFGYSVDNVASKSLEMLIHPDDWSELSAFLSDRISGAVLKSRFEFRGIYQDGTELAIECDLADLEEEGVVVGQRMYMWDITNRKMIENELLRSHEQMRMLSAHIQAAREGERTSIAHTIHDELGQNLTAMNMDISWIEKHMPPGQEAIMDKAGGIKNLIYETLQRVKRLSAELRPGLLDDLGLVAAIEWQADEFQKASGVKCKIDVDQQIPKLDEETSMIMFRVFQEIITNVARHAEATKVKIIFKQLENQLILEISDNGKGIRDEETNKQTSLGLLGIQERVRQLGGTVSFKGEKGRGTTVSVLIPMVAEGNFE